MSILGQPLQTKKYYLYKSYDRRNSGQENCHGHGYEVMRHKSQRNLSFKKLKRTLTFILPRTIDRWSPSIYIYGNISRISTSLRQA